MHTNVPGVRCVTPCSNRLDLGRYARSITLSTLPPCGVCRSSVPSVDSINYRRKKKTSTLRPEGEANGGGPPRVARPHVCHERAHLAPTHLGGW